MSFPPTSVALRQRVGLQTTAADGLLDSLITDAIAAAESYLGRPIVAVQRSFAEPSSRRPRFGARTVLVIPVTPIDLSTDTPVLYDRDGAVVDETWYTIDDEETGIARAEPGRCFDNGPYRWQVTVGLTLHPEWGNDDAPGRAQAAMYAAVLAIAADFYFHANVGAASETSPGGATTVWRSAELPARATALLDPYRLVNTV